MIWGIWVWGGTSKSSHPCISTKSTLTLTGAASAQRCWFRVRPVGTNGHGAIQISSTNSNTVATLTPPFSDPDAEALRQKVNERINALRR